MLLPVTVVYRPPETTDRQHPASRHEPAPQSVMVGELGGLTVLVVDDQADARDLIRRVLEDCAATVVTAGTAEDALRLVEERRPDVLVSDVGMPEADGFELLRRVRALGAARGGKVPAIALTAFARSEDRTRALRAGFLVHVAKPVDPSELVATVASVARRVVDNA
jgi:CheY-like chemotaxis protein